MKKVNLIQYPIQNPADLPLYGAGYIHEVNQGIFDLSELKDILNSITNNKSKIKYQQNSFIIIEKKLLYKKELDLSLDMLMIDFENKTMSDCENLTCFIGNGNKTDVNKFIINHPNIWEKFKINNKEWAPAIKKLKL